MCIQGLALVDYDNFRQRDQKLKADLELHAQTLVDSVTRAFVTLFPRTRELDLRLYGGWTDLCGLPSRDATWLHNMLTDLRGRKCGIIVRPALATTMIELPQLLLRGTVRGQGEKQRQKMVDGMMGCDALYMANHRGTYVGVVTDDDDLLPAAVSAHRANLRSVAWIRSRQVGSGVNDPALLSEGLRIHKLET